MEKRQGSGVGENVIGEFGLPADENEGGRRETACSKSSEDRGSSDKEQKADLTPLTDPIWIGFCSTFHRLDDLTKFLPVP
jgi:hypothetical protein